MYQKHSTLIPTSSKVFPEYRRSSYFPSLIATVITFCSDDDTQLFLMQRKGKGVEEQLSKVLRSLSDLIHLLNQTSLVFQSLQQCIDWFSMSKNSPMDDKSPLENLTELRQKLEGQRTDHRRGFCRRCRCCSKGSDRRRTNSKSSIHAKKEGKSQLFMIINSKLWPQKVLTSEPFLVSYVQKSEFFIKWKSIKIVLYAHYRSNVLCTFPYMGSSSSDEKHHHHRK